MLDALKHGHRRTVEALKIEPTLWLALPESEIVCTLGTVAGNHDVIRNGEHLLSATPRRTTSTLAPSLSMPIESDLVGHIKAWKLPRVLVIEPGIGRFELRAVVALNELLEDAVLVTQAITPHG